MGPTEQDIEQRPVFPQPPGFPPPFSAFDQPKGKKLGKIADLLVEIAQTPKNLQTDSLYRIADFSDLK